MDRKNTLTATTGEDKTRLQGTLAIGCFASICRNQMADALIAFARDYPDVEVGVHEMTRAALLPALRKGDLSLAVLPAADHPDLQSMKLWQDRVMVAVHRDHPLASGPAVAPERLLQEIFLVSRQEHGGDLHRFLAQRILPHEPSLDSILLDLSPGLLMKDVAAGKGVALVCGSQAEMAGSQVTLCPISADNAEFSIHAYWSTQQPDDRVLALLATMKIGR